MINVSLGLLMFDFGGGWVFEGKFQFLRDLLVLRIYCYLYSGMGSN